jgi:hypothetical protein
MHDIKIGVNAAVPLRDTSLLVKERGVQMHEIEFRLCYISAHHTGQSSQQFGRLGDIPLSRERAVCNPFMDPNAVIQGCSTP